MSGQTESFFEFLEWYSSCREKNIPNTIYYKFDEAVTSENKDDTTFVDEFYPWQVLVSRLTSDSNIGKLYK